MSEIKFRAWDEAYKKMCEPAGDGRHLSGWVGTPSIFEVMQYAGIKDKHGRTSTRSTSSGRRQRPCSVPTRRRPPG
jgi:hypothetical protein